MNSNCPLCRASKIYYWGLRISQKNKNEIRQKNIGIKYKLAKTCYCYLDLIDELLCLVDKYKYNFSINFYQKSFYKKNFFSNNFYFVYPLSNICYNYNFKNDYTDYFINRNILYIFYHEEINYIKNGNYQYINIDFDSIKINQKIKYPKKVKNKWKIQKVHKSIKYR